MICEQCNEKREVIWINDDGMLCGDCQKRPPMDSKKLPSLYPSGDVINDNIFYPEENYSYDNINIKDVIVIIEEYSE